MTSLINKHHIHTHTYKTIVIYINKHKTKLKEFFFYSIKTFSNLEKFIFKKTDIYFNSSINFFLVIN